MLLLFYYIYIVIEFISQLRRIEKKKEVRQFLEITVEPRRTPEVLDHGGSLPVTGGQIEDGRSILRGQEGQSADTGLPYSRRDKLPPEIDLSTKPRRAAPIETDDGGGGGPRGQPPKELEPRPPQEGEEEKSPGPTTTPKKKVRIQEPQVVPGSSCSSAGNSRSGSTQEG